jgi:hydrogenase nickel incorporation protein HypA/HybF
MHEWALAEAVAASVRNEMSGREGASLLRVNLVFGELQNIDSDIFRTALEAMLSDLLRAGGGIHVDIERARFSCNGCGARWGLDADAELTEEEREAIHFLPEAAHAFLRCPVCGGRDYQVTEGRGVALASIELVEPSEA